MSTETPDPQPTLTVAITVYGATLTLDDPDVDAIPGAVRALVRLIQAVARETSHEQ